MLIAVLDCTESGVPKITGLYENTELGNAQAELEFLTLVVSTFSPDDFSYIEDQQKKAEVQLEEASRYFDPDADCLYEIGEGYIALQRNVPDVFKQVAEAPLGPTEKYSSFDDLMGETHDLKDLKSPMQQGKWEKVDILCNHHPEINNWIITVLGYKTEDAESEQLGNMISVAHPAEQFEETKNEIITEAEEIADEFVSSNTAKKAVVIVEGNKHVTFP